MKQNKESTTEQIILETAEKLFLEKGFAMTSTTEIARIVGCNQALVHYYFRTKERLFDAIFEKNTNKFVNAFLETMEESIPFEEKVRKKIETQYDILKANPKLPFLFFNELNTNPERLNLFKEKIGDLPRSFFFEDGKRIKGGNRKRNHPSDDCHGPYADHSIIEPGIVPGKSGYESNYRFDRDRVSKPH